MDPRRVSNETQTVWRIDPTYTTAEFTIKNFLFFTTEGRFSGISGTIRLDKANIERSSVEATVIAGTIDTHNKRRDTHLRSHDFLSVDRYPEMRFESTKVERGRDRDTLRVTGALTIKDKTRIVVLHVTEIDHSHSPQGEEVAYYAAQTEINRSEFGVSRYPKIIGSKLKLTVHVQAVRTNSVAS